MAIWDHEHWKNWKFEYFESDSEISIYPGAKDFISLWNLKRGSQRAPQWSDYDWDDLAPWWGSLLIIDYSYDPFDYRYRLFGTKLVELMGIDVTGQMASEMRDEKFNVTMDIPFYKFVAENIYLARASGSFDWQNRDHVQASFIEVPLSSDQNRASHTISLLITE